MRTHGRRRYYTTRYRIDESSTRCNVRLIAYLRWHRSRYRDHDLYQVLYSYLLLLCRTSTDAKCTHVQNLFFIWLNSRYNLTHISTVHFIGRDNWRLYSRFFRSYRDGNTWDMSWPINELQYSPLCLTERLFIPSYARDGINAGRDGEWRVNPSEYICDVQLLRGLEPVAL